MLRFATALGSLALATLISAPALAQGVGVGIAIPGVQVGGQITLGIPPIALPPPPTVVVAPPRVVMVPPPVVMAQPPAVYYAPVPQRPVYYRPAEPFWGASRLGIDLRIDGATGFTPNVSGHPYGLGGAGIGLRYRAAPHFGFEGGVDFLGGRDWNDHKTFDFAGNLGGNLYFNPRSRAQLYLSGGLLVDHASAQQTAGLPCPLNGFCPSTSQGLSYNHVGGYAGLGLEIFATRRLAFHLDARPFVRQTVGGSSPEFTDPTTGHSTNTSAGIMGSGGMIFYF